MAPEKGLHLLAEAYVILRRELGLQDARLEVAGYLAPEHRDYLARAEDVLRRGGLHGEFRYHGTLDRAQKIAFLHSMDVLSVPSPYAEPKGLYLFEAMANGVPWVQPRHGAFPEIHAKTGGGLLFEPGNVRDLAEQLLLLARDREQALELGRRGALGVREHYTAAHMAERTLEVFRAVTDTTRHDGPRPRDGLTRRHPCSRSGMSPGATKRHAVRCRSSKGSTFDLAAGGALCVLGPSGSGKSTLLNVLGALEPPSAGTVTLFGRNPYALPEAELAAFRNREVGFVFQDHHLLAQCSVLENVLVPTLVARGEGVPGPMALEERARELLGRVGLAERLDHRPAELSGGERQRAALARALILRPRLLLCDEPTGNLDAASATAVANLLLELHQSEQAILVLVTHSTELASRFTDRRRLAGRRLEPVAA